MGQTTSKEVGTVVFTPVTPTQVSTQLAEALQSNPETDYTLRQYSSKYIEDKVAERLYQAKVEAEANLALAEKQVQDIEDNSVLQNDSTAIGKELSTLQKSLEGRPRRGQLDSEAEKSRDALVKCIEQNKHKILDCRYELDRFKTQVRKVESSLGL